MLEGIRERTEMEVPNALLLPHVVRQSNLLAVMPKEMADVFAKIYSIRSFKLPVEVPPVRTHMIWHRAVNDDLGHRWLRDQLEQLKASWKNPELCPVD
jgi:DNA-binding transcriptional LysR family regulator